MGKRSLSAVPPGRHEAKTIKVPYLGHVISAKGVSTDPAKIEAVQEWPVQLKVTDVRSFLGLASYYRRFIQNFAKIAVPLHRLTAKTTEKFKWSPDCDLAFRVLKEKLVSAPVLAFPCFDQEFVVDCDASDYGLGAVISQRQDRDEKVIAYASRELELELELRASVQHHQEGNVGHGVHYQAFPSLPVWKTLHD